MVSTYTTNKDIEKPGNGDYVDTWNVPLNGDMTVVDYALGTSISFNATTGSQTLGSYDHATKALNTYSYIPLIIKVYGAITASVTYTIPSGVGGQWIIYNTTTDSGSGGPYTVTFASGGAGLSVNVPRNYLVQIISDGTNVYSIPVKSNGSLTRTSFTATSGQTVFNVSYTPGFLLVFINGVLLSTADYVATDGTTVTLNTGCIVGDLVDCCPY